MSVYVIFIYFYIQFKFLNSEEVAVMELFEKLDHRHVTIKWK